MSDSAEYRWVNGAAWLLPDGTTEIVPGFHDEWIQANQEMVPGCANVVDVVNGLGWVSAVAYAQGYVELMIRSRADTEAVGLCVRYLQANLDRWANALVMTMDEEGYIKLSPKDFAPGNDPASRIRGAFKAERSWP